MSAQDEVNRAAGVLTPAQCAQYERLYGVKVCTASDVFIAAEHYRFANMPDESAESEQPTRKKRK